MANRFLESKLQELNGGGTSAIPFTIDQSGVGYYADSDGDGTVDGIN